jgi:hypothetical protein
MPGVGFVTIPGHIYMALALESSYEEARGTMNNSDQLIFHNEHIWVPLEVTLVSDSFLRAWCIGKEQWDEYHSTGQAACIPFSDAQQVYEPMDFIVDQRDLEYYRKADPVLG